MTKIQIKKIEYEQEQNLPFLKSIKSVESQVYVVEGGKK